MTETALKTAPRTHFLSGMRASELESARLSDAVFAAGVSRSVFIRKRALTTPILRLSPMVDSEFINALGVSMNDIARHVNTYGAGDADLDERLLEVLAQFDLLMVQINTAPELPPELARATGIVDLSGGLCPPGATRNRRISAVRVTEDERDQIFARAREAQLTVSAFVKAACLQAYILVPVAEVRVVMHLSQRIGNNMLQIQRQLKNGTSVQARTARRFFNAVEENAATITRLTRGS